MDNARSDPDKIAKYIDGITVELADILTTIDAERTVTTNQMRDTADKDAYLALAKEQNDWHTLRTRVYRIGTIASEHARKRGKP